MLLCDLATQDSLVLHFLGAVRTQDMVHEMVLLALDLDRGLVVVVGVDLGEIISFGVNFYLRCDLPVRFIAFSNAICSLRRD